MTKLLYTLDVGEIKLHIIIPVFTTVMKGRNGKNSPLLQHTVNSTCIIFSPRKTNIKIKSTDFSA
jgi:hypothetical protein